MKFKFAIFILCWCLIPCPVLAKNTGSVKAGPVFLIVVDGLELNDLQNPSLIRLHRLVQVGSIGLMNTATAGRIAPDNAYATIGNGTRSFGAAGEDFTLDESEREQGEDSSLLIQQFTGKAGQAPVNLSVPLLAERNATQKYEISVGALGESLRRAGLTRAVFGNADTVNQRRRYAMYLAMDAQGMVDGGQIGPSVLCRDNTFPYGLRTDYIKMSQWARNNVYDFMVLETGDLSRLEVYKKYLAPVQFERLRAETLQRIDWLLGTIIESLPPGGMLLIVSPTPSQRAYDKGERLTPLLLWQGNNGPGLLTSGTTHRPGFVANIDIAATVLAHFGAAKDPAILGQPCTLVPAREPLKQLADLSAYASAIHLQRKTVLQTYIIILILSTAGAMAAVLLRWRWIPRLRPWLLGVVATPLSMLLLGFFPALPTGEAIAVIFLFSALLAFISDRVNKQGPIPFALLAGLTVAALVLDLLTGARYIFRSYLGYDSISGARYFGLGNEYMGILVGAGLTLLALLPELRPSLRGKESMLFFGGGGLLTLVLALPGLGANAGGTLAALAAVSVCLLYKNKALGWKYPALLLVILVCGIAGLIWLDAGGTTHIGRAAWQIARGGLPEVAHIVLRKATMNYKLLRYSLWSWVLLSALIASGILLFRPVGVLRQVLNRYPSLARGLTGIAAGGVAAFFFNDSGVVAAATCHVFGFYTLLSLVGEEIQPRSSLCPEPVDGAKSLR